MLRNYKITYRAVKREHTTVIPACSKYDAKRRFYNINPRYEILSIEEIGAVEVAKK